jgi:hypothetical protein
MLCRTPETGLRPVTRHIRYRDGIPDTSIRCTGKGFGVCANPVGKYCTQYFTRFYLSSKESKNEDNSDGDLILDVPVGEGWLLEDAYVSLGT